MSIRRRYSEHPDAKLVIRSTSATSLELELHTSDGVTLAPFGPIHMEREPDRFFRDLFSEIEGLSTRHGTSESAHRELEDLGAELSKRLLPRELGRLLSRIPASDGGSRTLWIQSDEPWIPWELLRLPGYAEDRGFQGPFLGEAFAAARWLRVRPADRHLTPRRSLPLRRIAVVAPQDRRLDSVSGEVAFLEKLQNGERIVERIPADEESVRKALAEVRHDGWHFSGHGFPSDEPTRAEILFGKNQCLRSRSLYAGMLEANRPLVFLNACHTGRTGFSLTGIGGWAEGFLSAGAGAFLGAYWAIEDAPAARFTEVFYTTFLDGWPIAAAVRQARLAIRHEFPGDPTWMAYTLHAHPLAIRDAVEERGKKTPEPTPERPPEIAGGSPSSRRHVHPAEGPSRWRRARPAALLVASLLLISLVTVWAIRLWPPATVSVMVLSPVDKTGTSDEKWRAVAASELLRTALAFDGTVRPLPAGMVFRRQLELNGAERPDPKRSEYFHRALGATHVVGGSLELVFRDEGRFVRIDLYLRELRGGRERARVTLESPEGQWLESICEAARRFRRELGAGALTAEWQSEALRTLPTDPQAVRLYVTGLEKLWTFDHQGARRALSEAAAREPEHPLVRTNLATAALELGDLTLAYEASQTAYDRRSRLPPWLALEIEARFYEIREEWKKAVEVYRELRELFPREPEYGFLLASAQIFAAEPALTTLDELRRLPLSASERAETELLSGEDRFAAGELEPALVAAERAVRLAHDLDLRFQEARARLLQASVLETQGKLTQAIETLNVARILLQREPASQRDLQDVFYQLAMDVYRLHGKEAAEKQFEAALREFRDTDDQVGVAVVQSALGIVLTDVEAYSAAETVLEEALQIFSRLGMRREEGIVANSLGAVHQHSGRLQEAEQYYLQARKIAEDLGRKVDLAAILSNLGEVSFLDGDLEAARQRHEIAHRLNEETGAVEGQAYDLFRLGILRMAKGDLDGARESLENARAGYDELYGTEEPQVHRAEVLLALAETELLEKNFGDAKKLAHQAEQSFLELRTQGRAILAQIVFARTFLESDLAKARQLVDRARQSAMVYHGEDRRVKIALAVMRARLAARELDESALGEALAELEGLAGQVREVPYLLEIRLALAEAETAAGRTESARSRLHTLSSEAEGMGFDLVAEEAKKLLASSAL